MSYTNSILINADGYEVSVANGATLNSFNKGNIIIGSDGTVARFIKTDASGKLIIIGDGTAGAPSSNVITIQGITNGTAINVAGSTTDNSSNPSNKIPVLSARANAASPTWTEGNVVPLSVNTSGELRVSASVTNNSIGLNSTTAPTSSTQAGGLVSTDAPSYTNGNLNPLSLTTSGLLRVDISKSAATYGASTNGTVGISTNQAGITSLAYIWHASGNTKRIEIYRIIASAGLECGANHDFTLRGAFITAENATPGGTAQSVNPFDRDDTASSITGATGVFRTGATGAPTRVTGDLFSEEIYTNTGATNQKVLFDIKHTGKPIVLRASTAEGFEIRAVGGGNGNLSQAVEVAVTIYWMEI